MNPQQEVKLISYLQRIAQAADNIAKYHETVPHVKVPEYDISIGDTIQHVGYDDAQLGREK